MFKLLFLSLFSLSLFSAEYSVELDGDKVATLNSLNSINSGFLQTELDWKASLYSGYDYLVLYNPEKKLHKKENTKYIKDTAGIIELLQIFNKYNLTKPITIENDKKYISLKCKSQICNFSAQDKVNLRMYSGYVKKERGKIIDIYEKRNKLRIRLL